MFRIYEQSKFIDCRVSIYRSSYAQERPEDQNQEITDLIIFNVYKPVFTRESAQIKALYTILHAIIVSSGVDFILRPYMRYDHLADSKAFLICKWCFWCASNLSTRSVITKCPMCDNNGLLNSIPISDKEVYEIDYSQRTRIKLEAGKYCTNATT
jgi:hypothetical protein